MTLFKIIVNHSNDIINFISPIIGIIISVFIAWSTYRKQVVEKEVKTNVATFSYLLSLIIKNFEELSNIKEQVSAPALNEIDDFLSTLDMIEKYIAWATNNGESPIKIEVPDKVAYAKIKSAELSKELVISIATQQYFNYIDTTNFQKEVVLLSHFGDFIFGAVCNRLDTQYHIISNIQETIKQYNEENITKPRTRFKEFSFISTDANYKEIFNEQKNQMLYRRSLFEAYDTTVTRCLMTSYNAACHLEAFFYHYLKKHCVVADKLGIPFKSLQLDDKTFFDEKEFEMYLNTMLPNEYILFSIPLYKHLRRNFWDKLSDFIFYLKWN